MNEDERKLAADLGIESDDEDLDHMIRSSNEFKKPLMPKKQSATTPQQNSNFLDFVVKKNTGDSLAPIAIVGSKKSVSPQYSTQARRQTY
jgi:hypothetical protein